jgi:hypothetical protein
MRWIPALAGMTGPGGRDRKNPPVIPAKAGIQRPYFTERHLLIARFLHQAELQMYLQTWQISKIKILTNLVGSSDQTS